MSADQPDEEFEDISADVSESEMDSTAGGAGKKLGHEKGKGHEEGHNDGKGHDDHDHGDDPDDPGGGGRSL